MIEDEKLLQVRSRFDSFERFKQAIQGWGLEFQQLDCGYFEADLLQIGTADILITEGRFNRKLIQKGRPPQGMRTFALMAEGATPFIWRKQQVTSDCFLFFPQGAELDAISLAGFHVYTISISDRTINDRLQLEDQPSMEALLRRGGVLEGATKMVQTLRHYLKCLTSEVQGHPQLINEPHFREELCCEIFRYILNILTVGTEKVEKLPFSRHVQIIQSIENWLSENNHERHSVYELCTAFQVNERTLRRIFMEWYGVSPHQYLLAIRLNGVRKELYHSNLPESRISEIAYRWGFWHLGKFAMVYRRQFGELPSETRNNRLE